MSEHSFVEIINSIKDSLNEKTRALSLREDSTVEFKEAFNWANRSAYAKAMAAFANNRGGYLIFGVGDNPRCLVGLKSEAFEKQDDAKITEYLNGLFSPEVRYEKHIAEIAGSKVGFLWASRHESPPVMAIKTADDVREAEVYYRYGARNDKIKFPEMKAIMDRVKELERASWADLLSRIAKLGPEFAGILDMQKGAIHGKGGNILIDEALIPKLRFIKEGHFQEGGEPTLKLVGDVTPIGTKSVPVAVRITDDPTAPAMRDDALYDAYPFDYDAIIREASKRYSNFKTNSKFHQAMRGVKGNPKYCHKRHLNPRRNTSVMFFYSREVFDVLDDIYTRK